ncbi:MAG TPA: Gfo/Idh/MocA family oxidoreductase [Phycisphaeraceae bacterium]
MLRVVVIGLGPIGAGCARAIEAESGLELTGLVDTDPRKQGLALSELAQEAVGPPMESDPGLRIVGDLDEALEGGADVAVVTATSRFDEAAPLLEQLIERGVSVVSSCEQMAWPWYNHPELARRIDAAAQRAGVTLLGAGVNPGFIMDALPVMLSSMVRRVSGVRCRRRVDASLRRPSLQKRIGVALKPETFHQLAQQDKVGYAGLAESVALIAAGVGRHAAPGSIEETLEPVLAERAIPSPLGLVSPGEVAGLRNTARWQGQGVQIELDLTMAVGLADPQDRIILEGPVPVCLKIPGALPGDSATVAALLNHIPRLRALKPGLRTRLDVPLVGCSNRDR